MSQKEQIDYPQQEKPSRARRFWAFFCQWVSAAVAGVSALGLVRVLAPFLGFTIKVNTASLTLAVLFGTPGVILTLLLRLWMLT